MIYIALVRGINVGGNNLVGMSDLRALCGKLGFADARTLLQSGNLLFEGSGAPRALEARLEQGAKRHLDRPLEFFVRSSEEWDAIIAGNPFRSEAKSDPSHLLVACLKAAPPASGVKALQAAIVGRERVRVRGREGYLIYPDGIARSKLTAPLIDRSLATRSTARNWNTVLKIQALARSA